jgi:hypothetical protein
MNSFIIYLCLFVQLISTENTTTTTATTNSNGATTNYVKIKKPLNLNYTRKSGERIRLECEFETSSNLNSNDFTLYWVKNYQELIQTKKGFVHVLRKNMTSM